MLRPPFSGLLCAVSLALCACKTPTPAREQPADVQAEPPPTVQARTEQLQDAGFVVIETTCGIEVAIQVNQRSIRGRIPIVGFVTPDDDEALWEAPEVTVELFSLRADMIGVPHLAGAALLEPFRTRELNFSRQEAPGLDATAISLPSLPTGDSELALDQWQLQRREHKPPHRLEDAQSVYVAIGLDDVVVALLTHAKIDSPESAERIRAAFAQSLHIEDEVPDLDALDRTFDERDARDPRCKQDPTVVRRTAPH